MAEVAGRASRGKARITHCIAVGTDCRKLAAESLAKPLIINEEEGLVLNDRSSEPAAELAVERAGNEAAGDRIGKRLGEGIARLLRAAMAEPEGVAMEVVAAGTWYWH